MEYRPRTKAAIVDGGEYDYRPKVLADFANELEIELERCHAERNTFGGIVLMYLAIHGKKFQGADS